MKIKVSDLRKNPHRDFKRWPRENDRIEALKKEIESDDFMDNIVARKSEDGKYEIVYGHHRLEALKELGWEEVDIPVKERDEVQMLRGMINENLDIWQHGTAYIIESIRVAKDYLDKELSKYDDFNSAQEILSRLGIKDQGSLGAAKKGIGEPLIKKFLGENWSIEKIRQSLKILKNENIDHEAIIAFPKLNLAHAFFKVLKDNPGLPKEDQKPLADLINEELGDNKTAKSVEALTIKKLQAIHKLSNPEPEKVKVRENEKRIDSVRRLTARLSDEIKNIKVKSSGEETAELKKFLEKKNIPTVLESLDDVCGEVEFPDIDRSVEEGQGQINRMELIQTLKMLKPALAKKAIVEQATFYYFMEDRIMAHNGSIWVVIPFKTGLNVLVPAKILDDVLSTSGARMIDLELTEDAVLKIKDGEIEASINIASVDYSREYCEKVRAIIPGNGEWHEIPDGLFKGLKIGKDFVSKDTSWLVANSVYVKGNKIYATDGWAIMQYRMEEAAHQDFPIRGNQVQRMKNYFTRLGKYGLKQYRVETFEDGNKMIHFRGKNITVSGWLADISPPPSPKYEELPLVVDYGHMPEVKRLPEFQDNFEEYFKGERRDYREGVELPEDIIPTLEKFNRLLAQERSIDPAFNFESDRLVILRFTKGQLICLIMDGLGKEFMSKKFPLDHEMGEQGLVIGLPNLRMVLSVTRHFIGLNHGNEKDSLEFGNDIFRCLTGFTEESEWIKQKKEWEKIRLEGKKKRKDKGRDEPEGSKEEPSSDS